MHNYWFLNSRIYNRDALPGQYLRPEFRWMAAAKPSPADAPNPVSQTAGATGDARSQGQAGCV